MLGSESELASPSEWIIFISSTEPLILTDFCSHTEVTSGFHCYPINPLGLVLWRLSMIDGLGPYPIDFGMHFDDR